MNGSGNNLYININVTTDNLNLGKKNLSLTLKNQTAIGSLFKTKIFWTYFIVVCALIIVLIVLLLIFKRRYPKANFSVD